MFSRSGSYVLHTLFLTLLLAAASILSTPANAQDDQVIKIGAPLALTGGLADEGKKQQIAYQMWLDKVNAAGGIDVGGTKYKVELITYDYQTDSKLAAQMTEKLITGDKVNFLSSPFGSGHTKIAAGVAERYGIPIMASVASSESVYDQGFTNLFGTLAPNAGLTDAMQVYFRENFPDAKKVAILGREDVFPNAMAEALAGTAEANGYEVVYNERYAVGTLDHSTALTQIKAQQPDWIYVTGYTQDLVLARKQMADLGVTAPIVTMITGPAYKEFTDNLGELAEGVTSSTWWHHATTYTSDDVFGSTKNFYDEFLAKQGYDPDYVHASSAAALIALQIAIETAASIDPAAVRKALQDLDIVTFYGPINFGANGMNQARDLPIIQVQGGKPVVLYPPAIKQADVIPVPG
jgi:branched-chain amino acid transport system substrate-binding protein